jgi:hypothetical protein
LSEDLCQVHPNLGIMILMISFFSGPTGDCHILLVCALGGEFT